MTWTTTSPLAQQLGMKNNFSHQHIAKDTSSLIISPLRIFNPCSCQEKSVRTSNFALLNQKEADFWAPASAFNTQHTAFHKPEIFQGISSAAIFLCPSEEFHADRGNHCLRPFCVPALFVCTVCWQTRRYRLFVQASPKPACYVTETRKKEFL